MAPHKPSLAARVGKHVTPADIKSALIFGIGVAATFGFKLPDAYGAALLAGSAGLAAIVNWADKLMAFEPVGHAITNITHDAEHIAPVVSSDLLMVLQALPGKLAAEIAAALKLIQAGPTPVAGANEIQFAGSVEGSSYEVTITLASTAFGSTTTAVTVACGALQARLSALAVAINDGTTINTVPLEGAAVALSALLHPGSLGGSPPVP